MTKHFDNLKELAGYFKEQSRESKMIVLDDTILSHRVISDMDKRLGCKSFSLLVDPDKIPPDPTTELTFPATTPDTIEKTFLYLLKKSLKTSFQLEKAGDSNEVCCVIDLELGSWSFGDSFLQFFALSINDLKDLLSDQHLTYSTHADVPDPLRYKGTLELSDKSGNPLADVLHLLKLKPIDVALAGEIGSTADGPTLDLKAQLAEPKEINLGKLITIRSPFVGVRGTYVPMVDDGQDREEGAQVKRLMYVGNYVGAGIEFGPSGKKLSLQLEAAIHPGLGTVSLHVGPDPTDPGANASIKDLVVLVGDAVADFSGLFKGVEIAEQFLDKCLPEVVFKSFDTSFFLKSRSIGFISVTVGSKIDPNTGKPIQWSIFGGTLKMDFDLQWAISNPLGSNRHMWAHLTANLVVSKLPFKLSVDIPSMCISGEYAGGPLSLNLTDAVEKLTGHSITLPEDLAHLTLTELGFSADPQGKVYAFHLGGAADLNLFGTRILSITDGQVDVELKYKGNGDEIIEVNQAAGTDMTLKMRGIIGLLGLDLSVNATVSTGPDTDSEFEAHLVNQTVGSLITYLGRLVDPYFDLTFPTPWNALLDIKLDALTLKMNVTKGIVCVTYDPDIKFAFIDISKIGLIYQKAKTDPKTKVTTPSSTQVSLACSFFGQHYGDDKPMSWDPMKDPPPATPGADAVFDLNYLGLGQHVTAETGDLETMTEIITAMQKAMVPVDSGTANPAKLPGIRFDANSHWLIATRLSVYVAEIIAIFNDPDLYGLHISCSSAAGSLAGLEFEILYKKVTPTIGLYHLELTLPDSMRHLQFGEVAVTLPVVALDIYTNGNFRIDVGFPKGLDFSRSCSVQVFPFLGFGGFYFAVLSGATSRKVPMISNGSFDPVIEFGLALSLGVGKTIDKGPLHAGLYVTVIGIMEGVLGFFHKESHASTDEIYYHVKGTVAIIGKVYGKVDFKVITVEVSITAYASATLLVESHQPIHISIRAGVSVKAKVKVLFVTIHFSFHMTVKASFTIGSATPTPWHVIEEGRSKGQARLSQQPAIRPIQRGLMPASSDTLPHAASVRCLVNSPRRLASLQATFEAAAKEDDQIPLTVVMYPAFTQSAEAHLAGGEPATDTADNVSSQIVLLPFIENAIPPDGKKPSGEAEAVQDAAEKPLVQLVSHLLAWVIKTHLAGSLIDSPVVTAADLRSIYADLTSDDIEQTGCTYEKLTEFLNQNFKLHLEPRLTKDQKQVSATIFPILPALTMTAQGETPVDFSTYTMVDEEYEEKIDAYLRQLMVEYETSAEKDYDKKKKDNNGDKTLHSDSTDDRPAAAAADEKERSMATVIFQDYFVMMARMAVQGAIDLLEEYPYTVGTEPSPSLDEIANQYSTSETEHKTGKDETLESIATQCGVPISAIKKANPSVADKSPTDPLPEGIELVIPIGALTGWTTSGGDTLESLSHRFQVDVGTIKELNPDLSDIEPDETIRPGTRLLLPVKVTPESIVLANQDRTDILNVKKTDPKIKMWLTGVTYQTGPGDTLKTVADKFVTGEAGFLKILLATNQDKPVLQTGTVLTFDQDKAGLTYTTHEHDTSESVASFYLVRANGPDLFNLIENLAEVVTTILGLNPPPADPTKKMGPDTPIRPETSLTFTLPSGETVNYVTNPWDTPRMIAAYFLSPGSDVLITREFAYALIDLNNLGDIDPTKEIKPGTKLKIPTFSYRVNSGDSLGRINDLFGVDLELFVGISDLLAVLSVLDVPRFSHAISAGDSLKSIAASYNLSLEDLTAGIWSQEGLFAKNADITIPRVPTRHTTDLIDDLVAHNKFDDTAAMVSRFLLHGLRLPVNTPNLAALTAADMNSAETSAATATGPLYELIGQQFAPPASPAEGYEIDLSNTGGLDGLYFFMDGYYAGKGTTLDDLAQRFVSEKQEEEFKKKIKGDNPGAEFPLKEATWLKFPSDMPLTTMALNLTSSEVDQIHSLEKATFTPDIKRLQRLPLFRDTPFRWSLQKRIGWQAAVLPKGTFPADSAQHVTAPTIWPFQDNLKRKIDALPDGTKLFELYELMVGTQEDSSSKLVADQCHCYVWGTLVDFKVQTIASADESGAMPNSYNLVGTDDVGRDTLQKVWAYLHGQSNAEVTLQLLYTPSSVSADTSGLLSDKIDQSEVFILRTNLSTLSESGRAMLRARNRGAEPGASGGEYDAKISDPINFLKLLWECSVVHGRGYYLNYVTADKKGLPAHLFAQESEAALSLLILVKDAKSQTKHPPIGKFHNCAVVGQNIDSSASSIFVQPILHIVVEGDSLKKVADDLNKEYSLSLTAVALAESNEDLKSLLHAGALLDVGGASPYTIAYGDTLAGVAAAHDMSVEKLVNTGANATAAILEPGALIQIRPGQLRQTSTVPPGNVGYQLLRPDPDPDDTSALKMDPAQYLNTLFQLLGSRIGQNETFVSSAESLPAGPVDSDHDGTDGLKTVAIRNNGAGDPTWCYEKVLPIYRYVNDELGSDIFSPDPNAALPPAVSNPYRGIREPSSGKGDDLRVRLGFDFHDVYGNRTVPKKEVEPLDIPVGYSDDLIGIRAWPSVSAAYTVRAGKEEPEVQMDLSFHIGRYVPGNETPYDNALKNSFADRVKYAEILYQIWQPDLIFRLRTSLDQSKDGGQSTDDGYAPDTVTPPRKPYTLTYEQKLKMAGLAGSIYAFLTAARNVNAYQRLLQKGDTPAKIAQDYVTTVQALFKANADEHVTDFIDPEAELSIPTFYTIKSGDTIDSIAGQVSKDQLLELNLDVRLNAGLDIQTPARTYPLQENDTLRGIASTVHADAPAVAEANGNHPLTEGTLLTMDGVTLKVSAGDTLLTMVKKFSRHDKPQVFTTVADLGAANQNTPNLFDKSAKSHLTITDYVIQKGDTLNSMKADHGFDPSYVINNKENADLINLFATGTELQNGIDQYTVQSGDTLNSVTQHHKVSFDKLAAQNRDLALKDGAQLYIPHTVSLDNEAKAFPASTYMVGDDETLAEIAGKYLDPDSGKPFTAVGVAENNRHTPYLFKPGVDIEVAGKRVTVLETDTFSTLYKRLQNEGYKGTFDEFVNAVENGKGILQSCALFACPPIHTGKDYSLDDLEKTFGVTGLALVQANRSLHGLVRSGCELSYGKDPLTTITTKENDTLITIINRFAEKGVTVTLEDIATAFHTEKLFVDNAMMLPGPLVDGPTVPITDTPVNPDQIFPVTVEIEAARRLDLIDPDFHDTRTVYLAQTAIAPQTDPGQESKGQGRRLHEYAKAFEQTFGGLIKVATGKHTESDENAEEKQIWAVDFRPGALSFDIAGNSTPDDYDNNPDARYFALAPLSNKLVAQAVEIAPYESGKGLEPSKTETHNLAEVDMDVWAQEFLSAVDMFLSPEYAVPLYNLPADGTAGAATDGASCYRSAVENKGELAQWITKGLKAIFKDQTGGDLTEAQAALEQRLLVSLANSYEIDTVVQIPVNTSSSDPDIKTAARLSGKPVVITNGAAGESDTQAVPYSLSTAKVPLVGSKNSGSSQGLSYLTFLVDAKTKTAARDLKLNLRYAINETEHNIRGMDDISDYQASSWLTFILPIGGKADTGLVDEPLLEKSLADRAVIGRIDIPIPLRAYPAPPSLVAQSGTGVEVDDTDPLPQIIKQLKSWAYSYTFDHESISQDTTYLKVVFRGSSTSGMSAAAPTEYNRQLFAALAQFISAYPAIKDDLALLPDLVAGEKNPVVLTAARTLADLVDKVSDAWKTADESPAEAPLQEKQVIYEYRAEVEEQDHVKKLHLQGVSTTEASYAWPGIYALVWEEDGDQGEFKEYKLERISTQAGTTEAVYAYPPEIESIPISRYRYSFGSLNITELQSGEGSVQIKRNENLGEGRGKLVVEDFIYQTPYVAYSNPFKPLLVHMEDVNIREAGEELKKALENLFKYLFFENGSPQGGSINTKIAGGYGFDPAGSSAGAALSDESANLKTLLPVRLIPRFDFQLTPEWSNDFADELASVLTHWQAVAKPASNNGRFYFDLCLYAGAAETVDQPMLEIRSLYFPVKDQGV